MFSNKQFILISNQRCGSTWFITSLGNCKSFNTDFEIKWSKKLLIGKASPYHLFLEDSNFNKIFCNFKDLNKNSSCGSKFVFDFYKPFPFSSYEKFRSKFKGLNVIHITRDYIDILKSKLIGKVTHIIDERYLEKNRLIDKIVFEKQNDYLLIQKKILKKSDKIDFNIASSYLTNLFVNDVLSLSLKHKNNFLSVKYEDLKYNLLDLSKFLNVSPKDLKKNLYEKPVINKNNIKYEENFENILELRKINKKLKEKINMLIQNDFDFEKIISFDSKKNNLTINI